MTRPVEQPRTEAGKDALALAWALNVAFDIDTDARGYTAEDAEGVLAELPEDWQLIKAKPLAAVVAAAWDLQASRGHTSRDGSFECVATDKYHALRDALDTLDKAERGES